MRLSKFEVTAIKNTFNEVFGSGKIYLFGSRVDDTKKGGDIDLYICPNMKVITNQLQKKLNFYISWRN